MFRRRKEREDEEVRLARAMGHPRRVAILECLNANGPMAPTELAEWLDADLSNLSYHVRVLARAGLAEEAGQEPGIRGRPKTTTTDQGRAAHREDPRGFRLLHRQVVDRTVPPAAGRCVRQRCCRGVRR